MAAGRSRSPTVPGRELPECFVLRAGHEVVRWPPPEPSGHAGHELAYWGRVLAAMSQRLETGDLTFYLVWDGAEELPTDGPGVVVVGVLPESWRAVSRWTDRVAVTFQAGGRRPRLHMASSNAGLVPAMTAGLLRTRRAAREASGGARRLAGRRRMPRRPGAVFDVPLGYCSEPGAEPPPILERPVDLSFAGSVNQWQGWWGSIQARLGAPKVRCRREMLQAVDRLRRSRPDVVVSTRVTGSFAESSPFLGSYEESRPDRYWGLLSATKLCLTPGGTHEYTYRHFEAMRSGCVIVTDTRPRGWYMRGAGLIELSGWDDLERAVLPVLGDDAEVERLSRASLECWRRHCSEEAAGRFMADRLNELSARRVGVGGCG